MKLLFPTVVFTDDCRASLDGADGRSSLMSQQGCDVSREGLESLFWTGIMEGVRMTSAEYMWSS